MERNCPVFPCMTTGRHKKNINVREKKVRLHKYQSRWGEGKSDIIGRGWGSVENAQKKKKSYLRLGRREKGGTCGRPEQL